jgi:tRNA A-37 threonylcarbamoyl transferase component Bud32
MATLLINPRYALHLWHQGLRSVPDFLNYAQGTVVGGHPTRDVSFVQFAGLRAFLKRQFQLPWKEYLESWWAGFGWASKAVREWRILQELRNHGIGCPEPIAVGEHGQKAFLLVRALPEAVDLPTFLARRPSVGMRHDLLRHVGQAVAKLHSAGFTHPDLYAKHVFLNTQNSGVSFIDFQRTRRRRSLPWNTRARDLAALDASLSNNLVSASERLLCLQAYLERSVAKPSRHLLRQLAETIAQRRQYLLKRRKIQAMQQATSMIAAEATRVICCRVLVPDEVPPSVSRIEGAILRQQRSVP